MKNVLWYMVLIAISLAGCKAKSKGGETAITDAMAIPATDSQRESMLKTYPQVPDASAILNAGDTGKAVYALCLQRFTAGLAELKKEAEAINARLIITILSPETGEAVTTGTRAGIPSIMDAARKEGIEAYDFTTPLAKYTPQQITQMPVDGHWSVAGSKIVADLYKPVITKHATYRSTKTFTDKERPATFGDLAPDQDAALDGGKGIPYQLITNKQGFRMDYPLTFPKTRQRILFLGDSQIYSPFLDNNQIPTAVLQQQFPDMEIINAGVVGYTMDDYVSLLSEKAKYAEPDIIIVVTNPNDIGDFYFTQRNRMSRSKSAYLPASSETSLYKQLFN